MKPNDLIEHPEGGRYREVYRSGNTVCLKGGSIKSGCDPHLLFIEIRRSHCSKEAALLLSVTPEMARYLT